METNIEINLTEEEINYIRTIIKHAKPLFPDYSPQDVIKALIHHDLQKGFKSVFFS